MKKALIVTLLLALVQILTAQSDVFNRLIVEGDEQYNSKNYLNAYELFVKASEKAENTEQLTIANARVERSRKAIFRLQVDLQKALAETKNALKIAREMRKKAETAIFDKAVRKRYPTWQAKSDHEDLYILQTIDTLNFSDKGLFHIPDEVTSCPNLKHINLINNMNINWNESESVLSMLDSNISIFASLPDFQCIPPKYRHLIKGAVIDATGNSIPVDVMQQKQLTHLQVIHLTNLPENIGDLSNLIELNLEDNTLNEIPNSIGKLHKLEIFRCGKNNLDSIPNELCNLINLRELSFSENNLAEIPQQIGNLKNIEYLDLSENHIYELPSSIANLSLLTQLDLHSNYFSKIPIEIGSLYNLNVLNLHSLNSYERRDLDGNIIGYSVNSDRYFLPVEICNLDKLTDLDIGYLGLTIIPNEIGKLRSLKVLNLSSNHLDKLPQEIENLKGIEELNIAFNAFNEIPDGVYQMPQLRKLDCKDNEIDSVSTKIFELKMHGYVYFELGVQLMEKNNFEQAFISFNHSIDADLSSRPATYAYMAICANKLNDSIAESEYLNLFIHDAINKRLDYYYFINSMINRFFDFKCYDLVYKLTSSIISKTEAYWYIHCINCLYAGKPLEAIEAAEKAIEMEPVAKSFESKLALGYLLSNQWKKAEQVYQKWDGQTFSDIRQPCRQKFLEDIVDLEKAGITHIDFQKVREMLSN